MQNTGMPLDELCINTIRMLSVDAVQKADSGHPGLPMGAAPMAYVLWDRFLKHNPSDPQWFDRDRFVLSAGHGSMLLYSLLHLYGYDVPMEQIKNFRQWGSKTPGHPERGFTPGVEITTGPLGQGFGNGVGMAMAEAFLGARYNRPDFKIIDHFTYGLVSDGDLMEGVASEAASLAGHLGLGKLIYFYDNNHITLAADTHLAFTEDRGKRFESYGWHVQSVEDGNDLESIARAVSNAQNEIHRPSIILVTTHIGYGSPHKQDTFEAHGAPLGAAEVKATKENLHWPLEPSFYVPEEASRHFLKAVEKGKGIQAEWAAKWEKYSRSFPKEAAELTAMMKGELPKDLEAKLPVFPADAKGEATRKSSGKILNALAAELPGLLGGSADLNPSTFTALKGLGNFDIPTRGKVPVQGAVEGGFGYEGRNIAFGVREHAMAAILNGLAAHGALIPFGATFLSFSDYMRPSIRLAALMELRTIYVFTHDSLGVGEDGPTHQPVEQVAALRVIPNLLVIRPCDANETAVAWSVAVRTSNRPTALILTRQNVPTLDRTKFAPANGLIQGAYILSEASGGKPELLLIGTGSEVHLLIEAQQKLAEKNIRARVVSMPSRELFLIQPQPYRDNVLPPDVKKRLVVEAGTSFGWHRFTGDQGEIIGVDHFGSSAPGDVVMREYGFTTENVFQKALALMKRS